MRVSERHTVPASVFLACVRNIMRTHVHSGSCEADACFCLLSCLCGVWSLVGEGRVFWSVCKCMGSGCWCLSAHGSSVSSADLKACAGLSGSGGGQQRGTETVKGLQSDSFTSLMY